MSFLDNLENNLKALESREEKDPEKVKRDQERREAERNAALLRAPHVEALKTSAFTSDLLTQCRLIGRERRVLVRFTWLGEMLRLDVRMGEKEKRLEFSPTAAGILLLAAVNGVETARQSIDLGKDDAAALVRTWLTE